MEEDIIKNINTEEYKHGFVSSIEVEEFPKGLNEDIIRMISKRKEEPEWLPQGLPQMADHDRTQLGTSSL